MQTQPRTDMMPATVAILLATYNGERYLADQLDSFERQTWPHWKVWASDDGSQDATLALLRRYQQRWGAERLVILKGPSQGASRNFLSMVHHPAIQADYYAYSDQDDIWEDDKLHRALAWLSGQQSALPALYCTRTRLVDAQNNELGISPLFRRTPSFATALMRNITGGNTMVFNQTLRRHLQQVPGETSLVIFDWWTYIVATAIGGVVHFDPTPGVRYRQHDGNLIGMSADGPSLASRLRKLFTYELRHNGDLIIEGLETLRPQMPANTARTLDLYAHARRQWLLPRLIGFKRAGLHRLTIAGDLGLLAAAILNKL